MMANAAKGMKMRYNKISILVAEDHFVLTGASGALGDQPTAFYDLWRLENGLIVEHWDIIAPIQTENRPKGYPGKCRLCDAIIRIKTNNTNFPHPQLFQKPVQFIGLKCILNTFHHNKNSDAMSVPGVPLTTCLFIKNFATATVDWIDYSWRIAMTGISADFTAFTSANICVSASVFWSSENRPLSQKQFADQSTATLSPTDEQQVHPCSPRQSF